MVNQKMGNRYIAEETERDCRPYVRISRISDRDSARCIPQENYQHAILDAERLRGIASKIVFGYENYVHANDREQMRRLAEGDTEQIACDSMYSGKRVPLENAERILRRAERLKRNVPGIFKPTYETFHSWTDSDGIEYQHFPTVDNIANIASRRPRFDARIGNKTYSGATSISNVHFLSQVIATPFYDQVKTEILDKVDELSNFSSDESRTHVLNRVGEVIDLLRQDLRDFGSPGLVRVYTGSNVDVMEMVSNPFWYTGFTENSVDKILVDYWATFAKNALDSDKSVEVQIRGIPQKVAKLFPNSVPNLEGLENRRQSLATSRLEASISQEIDEMMRSRDYSRLNPGILKRAREIDASRLKEGLVGYISEKDVSIEGYDGNRTRDEMLDFLGLPKIGELREFYDRTIADAFIKRLDDLAPVDFYNAAAGFCAKSDWSKLAIKDIEKRMKNPDFQERLVEQHASKAQSINDISLGTTRSRFGNIASDLIDRIGERVIEDSNTTRFVGLVNDLRYLPHRAHKRTRKIISERIFELIKEDLDRGVPFATAVRNAGLENPDSLRNLIGKRYKVNS